MGLGLQGVKAEVGQDAKAVGAVVASQLDREFADLREYGSVAPELALAHVAPRDKQQHDRHPLERIVEDDDIVVLVANVSGDST